MRIGMGSSSAAKSGDGAEREAARRRLAPEARRAELLAAALEVFVELGFERATLQDVADRAGVTKGALYHYFESKDELFLELMRERLAAHVSRRQALVASAAPSTSREALLRELLEAIWASLEQPGMLAITRLILTELPKFPEIGRRFFEEFVLPARHTMREALERQDPAQRGDPEFRDALVSVLPGMMLGVALARRAFETIDPDGIGGERAREAVVEVLLRGILGDGRGS